MMVRVYGSAEPWHRTGDPYVGGAETPVTLHRYLYGNVSPTNFTDPTGLFGLADVAIAAAIVGVLATLAFTGLTFTGQANSQGLAAQRAAALMVDAALIRLAGGGCDKEELEARWFGIPRPAESALNRARVEATFYAAASALQMTISFARDVFAPLYGERFARVEQRDGKSKIWLRSTFYRLPMYGSSGQEWSKARILLHEVLHDLEDSVGRQDLVADDLEYDRSPSLGLARRNPDRAIGNADNYSYFAEEAFLGRSW